MKPEAKKNKKFAYHTKKKNKLKNILKAFDIFL